MPSACPSAMIETKPKRRWFRFGLRTLFVVATALALVIGWQANIAHRRRAMSFVLGSSEQGHFPPLPVAINIQNPAYTTLAHFGAPNDTGDSADRDLSSLRRACGGL